MMVEAGERQPRSLSSAYRTPSKPELRDAAEKLRREVDCNDENYGPHEAIKTMTNIPEESGEHTLTQLVNWVRETVARGETQ